MAPLPLPLYPPIAPIPAPRRALAPGAGVEDKVEYEVSDDHLAVRGRHERAVHELLQRRRAKPIMLFMEKEMERRDRLRALMVRLEVDGHFDRLLRAQEDAPPSLLA